MQPAVILCPRCRSRRPPVAVMSTVRRVIAHMYCRHVDISAAPRNVSIERRQKEGAGSIDRITLCADKIKKELADKMSSDYGQESSTILMKNVSRVRVNF